MPEKKGKEQGKNKLTLVSSQEKGGKNLAKKIVTVTCLYCSKTYDTDDPDNFRMPPHRMPNHKHNTPCLGSNGRKKDFSWMGKNPHILTKPGSQSTL